MIYETSLNFLFFSGLVLNVSRCQLATTLFTHLDPMLPEVEIALLIC